MCLKLRSWVHPETPMSLGSRWPVDCLQPDVGGSDEEFGSRVWRAAQQDAATALVVVSLGLTQCTNQTQPECPSDQWSWSRVGPDGVAVRIAAPPDGVGAMLLCGRANESGYSPKAWNTEVIPFTSGCTLSTKSQEVVA